MVSGAQQRAVMEDSRLVPHEIPKKCSTSTHGAAVRTGIRLETGNNPDKKTEVALIWVAWRKLI